VLVIEIDPDDRRRRAPLGLLDPLLERGLLGLLQLLIVRAGAAAADVAAR
jgi:hypothetical protein